MTDFLYLFCLEYTAEMLMASMDEHTKKKNVIRNDIYEKCECMKAKEIFSFIKK